MSMSLSAPSQAVSVPYFDVAFYLDSNPDVLAAVSLGQTTAFEHFVNHGAKEGRSPTALFSATAYLIAYSDVADAVGAGQIHSAWDHFVTYGVLEGRSSGTFLGGFDEAAYLEANPDVAAAVDGGGFRSGYEHFLLFGAGEGRVGFTTDGVAINPPLAGQIFTLTDDLDNIQGTSGDDTVIAPVHDANGNPSVELEFDDAANAGDGVDTLRFEFRNDANVDTADYRFTNFERVELVSRNNLGDDVAVDFGGMSGLQEVEVRNFADGNSNITILDVDAPLVTVNRFDGDDIFVGFRDDVVAPAVSLNDVDANDVIVAVGDGTTILTINLDDVNIADDFLLVSGADLTSVAININGESIINDDFDFDDGNDLENLASVTVNANADFTISDDMNLADSNGTDVTTLLTINGIGNVSVDDIDRDSVLNIVYTGSGSLTIDSDLNPGEGNLSFDASTATGDVGVGLDVNDNNLISYTYSGSQGVDTVEIETNSMFNLLDAGGTAVINGGAGTSDRLIVNSQLDIEGDAAAVYSNFEILQLGELRVTYTDGNDNNNFNADWDLTGVTGFSTLVLDDANGNDNADVTIAGLSRVLANDIRINYSDNNDNNNGMMKDLALVLANGTGLNDTMQITFSMDNNEFDTHEYAQSVTANNVETITLVSTGDANSVANDGIRWNEIHVLNGDRVETLVINGDLSLDINDNINTQRLELIDIRGFSGEFLRLEDIDTSRDLELRGASVDSNVFVSTVDRNSPLLDVVMALGDGNNFIVIDGDRVAGSIINITVGDGNNLIGVDDNNDNASVTILTGDGDNNINIDDALDVTVTTGSGDDAVRVDDAEGDVVINVGAGNDLVGIDLNDANSYSITLGAGDDSLFIDDFNDANSSTIFTVTDFSAADDIIRLDNNDIDANVNANSLSLNYGIQSVAVNSINIDDSNSNTVEFIEFSYDANRGGADFEALLAAGNLDGNELLAALGLTNDMTINVDDNVGGFIAAYNGGDAYLWYYDDNNASSDLIGSEIKLIGVLENTAVGALTAANFDLF